MRPAETRQASFTTCIGLAGGLALSIYPAALALSLATAVFFWSGEQYHRAWVRGFPPDPAKNRSGDFLSAVGAIPLAGALFALGKLLLACTAGLPYGDPASRVLSGVLPVRCLI